MTGATAEIIYFNRKGAFLHKGDIYLEPCIGVRSVNGVEGVDMTYFEADDGAFVRLDYHLLKPDSKKVVGFVDVLTDSQGDYKISKDTPLILPLNDGDYSDGFIIETPKLLKHIKFKKK